MTTAREAEVQKDQIERFLGLGYCPQPKQLYFHGACRSADKENGPDQIGFGGARGPGKALALNTPIPTPSGWSTMGELAVGDEIFAPDGSITQVTGCSPIQYERDCYDVIFSDGSRITADADHLWVTFSRKEREQLRRRSDEFRAARRLKRPSRGTGKRPDLAARNRIQKPASLSPPIGNIRTTKEIAETLFDKEDINHSVMVTSPIRCNDAVLPIEPYMLGLWLGDGDSGRAYFTTADIETVQEIRRLGWQIDKAPAVYRYKIQQLNESLLKAGLIKNKHIPKEYLRASFEQRLALLQGLMDTDGSADKDDGGCEFTSTNIRLAFGFYELALSLGIKASILEGIATLNGREISPKWRIRFMSELPCFRLTRKLERQKRDGFNGVHKMRYIVAVNRVQSVPVKCITVAHESRCFLAGRQFIPTHNSPGVFAQIALDDCQRCPGLKVLYIRKVAKNAREQFEDLRRVVLSHVAHTYNRSSGIINFPNGSRIVIGHFKNESDVDQYLGLEYDVIAIEEATTLSLSKYKTLRDSNRTSKPNWKPRIYASTNPGNIGHVWFKERFIVPARNVKETDTRFIFATIDDNKFVDRGYKKKLEDNTGWKLKAYRFGDWDIAAGQYFSTWNYDAHTVTPFVIPSHQSVWGCFDYGFTHPTASYLLSEYDGEIQVTGEHVEAKQLPATHAASMRAIAAKHGRDAASIPYFAGADCFANKGDANAKTIAQQYLEFGIHLHPAPVDRVSGWGELLKRLGDTARKTPIMPTIKIDKNCIKLIECIPALQHNPNKPEDVLKWDVDEEGSGGDDPGDSLRYGLMAKRMKWDYA